MVEMTPHFLTLYDNEIVNGIMEKYGYSYLEALKKFLNSQTYSMMLDPEMDMIYFSPGQILEIWEAEQITGSPVNSVYIRSGI